MSDGDLHNFYSKISKDGRASEDFLKTWDPSQPLPLCRCFLADGSESDVDDTCNPSMDDCHSTSHLNLEYTSSHEALSDSSVSSLIKFIKSLTDFEVLCTGDWNVIGMHTGRLQRAKDEERRRLLKEGTPELRYCLHNYHPWGYISEFDVKEHEDLNCIMDPRKDRLAYDCFMEKVKSNRERLGIM